MARTYEVVLDINGRLGNLQSAINSASRSLQSLGRSANSANALASRSTQRLQSQLSQLNRNAQAAARFRELNSSLSTFTQRTAQARQQANQLYADLARQERQVEQMRQSFQNLQTARNNGQVSARAVAQGRQELRQAEQGLNQLRTQYNSAQSNAENLNSALRRQTSELNQLQSAFNNAGVNASNFARHEADVARQITQTQQQLRRSQNVDAARGRMNQAGQDVFNAYGNFQGAIDTASSIMSPIKSAVQNAMTFEHTMSRVKALTQSENIRLGNTAQVESDMSKLTAQARELGATTQFTMTQAAEAMTYLGQAGWKTEQIYGTMPGMLNLAAGAGTDLARTADIVSDNMTAMGVPVSKASHFMDVYAYAMANSNVNLESLGETMKYAAPIANAYGASLEDAAAMTMIMGNAGIKGSMAGTALRMGLLRLSGPPKKASKEMEELGISMSDATKMAEESAAAMKAYGVNIDDSLPPQEKMFEVLKQLSTGMKDCSREEKLAAVSAIFGANAASGWVNILEQGPEGFAKFRDALRNCDGYSKQFAKTANDDTTGAMIAFDSAVDAISNSLGTVFLPQVRSAAEALTPIASGISQFIEQHQGAVQAAGAIAAAIAGITVAGAGFSLAVTGIRFISASFALAGAQATLAAGRVAAFWATMTAGSSASTAVNVIRNLGTAFASAGRASMAFVFSPVGAALTALALAGLYCYTNWERVAPIFSNLASTLSGSLGGAIATLTPAFSNLINTVQRLGPALAVIGGAVFGAISVALTAITGLGATIISTLANVISTVINIFSGLGNIIASVLAGNWDGVWQGFTQAAQAAVDGVVNIISGLFSGIGDTFSSIFSNIQSLIGGEVSANVSATQANAPESSPAIDTSQTQAQIDALGQSAQATADAQQNIAQVGQGLTDFSTNIAQVGTDLTAATTGVQTFNTEATTAGTNLNLVGTNATQAATELTNLQTNAAAASPALQQVQASATSASTGLSQIAGAASSAASGLSQISGAAGSVASALQAKAAQISSISISAPKVAANAKGGIYKQGAFLTTFAEKSPEAAIPLDNSARAKELWTQTGQALGTLPGNPPTPETPSKLTPEERKILSQAALEYQQTGRANLPAPTEQSSAEYRRRYENNRKLQDAMKYLPQSSQGVSSARQGNIFSGRVQTQTRPQNLPSQPSILPKILNPTPTFPQQKNLPATKTLPPMTQTQPRQVGGNFGSLGNIFSGKIQTPNFNPTQNKIPSLENIFSGGVKLPQLPELPKADNIFSSLLEKVFPTDSAKNSANPVQSTPQITVNITIQGNADANTVREAGQVLAVDLRRELDTWWRDKKADEQRRSFV